MRKRSHWVNSPYKKIRMKGKVTVIKKSASTTLQDLGRIPYANYGVPRAGAVDSRIAHKCNLVLGNDKKATVMEWALIGPKLHFTKPTFICLSHNSNISKLNGKPVKAKRKIYVAANSTLELGTNTHEVYQYLAIKDGFISKIILGSQSSLPGYKNGIEGDLLYQAIRENPFQKSRPIYQHLSIPKDELVRVIPVFSGPEYHLLSKDEKYNLEQYFSLSQNRNRMGIHIKEKVFNSLCNILSVPTIPGTIQLTSGGNMIILGKDCQTTGGYPRILFLPENSLTSLYQLQSGIKFRFELIKEE